MNAEKFDLVLLNEYLERHVEGFNALKYLEKFAGGQSNPTYLIEADSGKYVLRKKPHGELLKSAHAVDREYKVISALGDYGFEVPKAFHLSGDDSPLGTMFYVMSFEEGNIFWDPKLPGLEKKERSFIYQQMAKTLAKLHSVDIHAAGLGDYGRPGNYFERQLSRWSRQYRASQTNENEAMETLIHWLEKNIPEDDGKVTLIHGDYRLDNLIIEPNNLTIKAILDWELSTLGHPYSDIAYQCMQLRMSQSSVLKGLAEVDRESLGIPSEDAYLKMYCKEAGIDEIQNWSFYLAFSFFRFSAILQGVYKRSLDGNAVSEKALEYGKLSPVLVDMALKLIK
ncbi:phosphotransferase [Brumicola pallidula]|jgi:aminoglycoside phosphotransferase (APT) family kinase protein|uniref:Aminoglycoside phosphotransferase n=1 Tax=Brumicola pallidula DSM 14239 = ACAM 615 TaxID=1121922 RepID=K6YYI5_9ALTE|nr:phosphotransferase [Glaciecola pallidula]GAC29046.1 aminoglycoside phosphotransferase [Glaciecola pallidula DSM 14239 = ACAM 615]